MSPLVILWLWRVGGMLTIAAALWGGVAAWERHIRADERAKVSAIYEAAITKQKILASLELSTEKAKVAAAELALQNFKNQQELKDDSNKKTVSVLSARVAALVGAAGRLRDPYQTGCGCSGGSAKDQGASSNGNSAGNTPATSGLLSAELTGFLQSKMKQADVINLAYISCRAEDFQLREQLNKLSENSP